MTEDSDTIQLFEAAAKPRKEIAVLIESARESFRLIEPWSYARSDHPETTSLLQRVQGQVNAYYIALDSSIDIAEQGHTFALDCYDLCDFFLDPNNSAEDITDYISLMREKAQTALVAAKEMTGKFRSVRQGLNEITGDIPAAVLRVQKNEEELQRAQRYEEKRALGAEILSGTLVAVGGALGAALAISGIIALHSTVVLIPVALPLMALVVKIISHDYTIVARERATQAQSCGYAMEQLRKSAHDLTELTRQMDNFADWWQDMDTLLGTLVSRISQLRGDRLPRLRVKTIQRGWKEVRDQYLDYKTNISKLQDHYPSSKLRLGSIEE